MIPISGFMPDADPTTPGVIVDCDQFIPFESGYKGAPTGVDVGVSALGADCAGAAVLRSLDGSAKLFAGTATKLYQAGTTAWTDVSRAGDYILSADDLWSFAQFGDINLAATISAQIQKNTGAGFTDLTGAPKAKIIESVAGFVMALYTDETVTGERPDGWWCSGLYDYTTWTASAATQAQNGRLFGTEGPIVAGKALGNDMIAYKNRAIYVGRYEGPPLSWSFTEIPGDVGCVGQNAVVDVDIGHVFVGLDNIYFFDGVRPVPIATGTVRDWFISRLDPTYRYKTALMWDKNAQLVWIFFPSAGNSGMLDSCLVWHLTTKRWGVATRDIEQPINYVSPGITYDGGSPLITTYDGTSLTIAYDSPFWLASGVTPSVIGTDGKIYTLSGVCDEAYFTTGDIGEDGAYLNCTRLRVRFTDAPDSATVQGYYKFAEGDALTTGANGTLSDGKMDCRQAARFHRFKVTTGGDFVATAYEIDAKRGGTR